MRQASWEEMWRAGEAPVEEEKPPWWSKLAIFSWEELITLLIMGIAYFTIVQSISDANWVTEMPSLGTIAFLGLATGLALSRFRVNELLLHPIALIIGTIGVIYVSTESLGGSFTFRASELYERVVLWGEALFSGGISNDDLPFVALVVSLSFLTAYISAWAIFRWYNAWLGLIPGGLALLTNISYLPSQTSVPLIVYLFCAILLVARVNVLRNAREWRRERTNYPDLISLHVLNVTVWVALLLLALAWILPVGSGSGALYSLWREVTSPIAGPINDLGRVFASIDSKKSAPVHRFGTTLPLQGEVTLTADEVMQVTATEAGFLRAQSYDFYTAQGWKIGDDARISATAWPAQQPLLTTEDIRRELRRPVSIQVTTTKEASVIVSAGYPLAVDRDSRIVFGSDQADVTSIRPEERLDANTQYRVDSAASNASEDRLRAASTTYPAWVGPYLQLPSNLPQTIRLLANQVTSGAQTPYDRALLIEQHLRTFAIDTKIDAAPPRRDSVEYFLFDLRRGYFDYHASAMVIMLRTLNIPARLAVGYVVRQQNRIPDTNTFSVYEGNAFAWPEVYFPGYGWVEFNPTPSEEPVRRLSGGDDPDSDIEEDEFDDSLVGGGGVTTEPVEPTIEQLQTQDEPSLIGRIILFSILGFLAFTAVVSGTFQYVLQRGLGGMDYRVQTWEKTLRLARWAKVRPQPQETPRDIVARLRRELPDVQDLDYLGESFIRSRYGHKDLAPAEKERLTALWRDIRKTLLQRFLRWK
jgi:transglutaminase-like putative cysteine protease